MKCKMFLMCKQMQTLNNGNLLLNVQWVGRDFGLKFELKSRLKSCPIDNIFVNIPIRKLFKLTLILRGRKRAREKKRKTNIEGDKEICNYTATKLKLLYHLRINLLNSLYLMKDDKICNPWNNQNIWKLNEITLRRSTHLKPSSYYSATYKRKFRDWTNLQLPSQCDTQCKCKIQHSWLVAFKK